MRDTHITMTVERAYADRLRIRMTRDDVLGEVQMEAVGVTRIDAGVDEAGHWFGTYETDEAPDQQFGAVARLMVASEDGRLAEVVGKVDCPADGLAIVPDAHGVPRILADSLREAVE